MRTRSIPLGARHLRTYGEFESYLADFVNGIYPFLWIVGRPGVAKTESIQRAVRGQTVHYCNGGQLTLLRFFIDCHEHRGQPVILDDAEHLLEHRIGAKLVSALGDTGSAKLMSYATTSRVLGDVPQTFYTTSPLCIIANQAMAHEAIQSRAIMLYVDPTNPEIHRAAAAWFWDQEIHDWFGNHLHDLPPLDSRWYGIAAQDKRAGRDWRQIILKTHSVDRASSTIRDLENDASFPTREDKARRFVEQLGNAKGASRATYFRLRQRLEEEHRLAWQDVPTIQLRHSKPPATPSLLELESRGMVGPTRPEEEPRPLDLPARNDFVLPIRGRVPTPGVTPRQSLDDALSWERPANPEDEEDDE